MAELYDRYGRMVFGLILRIVQDRGTAEDLVPAVLLLASDRASFITGQTLSVSGGYTMM